MLRRLGLAISYFVAIVYILSILLPAFYCWQHGCRGGGEGDAFMPAFFLTPVGAVAAAFSLHNAVQNIRRKDPLAWIFWPIATIFTMVLIGVMVFVALFVYFVGFHHR